MQHLRASSARFRFFLWGAWCLACVLATAAAAGWPTDNGLSTWMGSSSNQEAVTLLRDGFGGDEVVVARVQTADGGSLASRRSWLDTLGPRLATLPAVAQVVDPLALPDRAGASLEDIASGDLARALDLFGPGRLDYLLVIGTHSPPGERARLAEELREIGEETRARSLVFHAAGHPLVAAELDRQSARVERIFVPLLVVLAAAMVAWLLGSLRMALATLLPAILASSGARAALFALGLPSNMILVALGPLALVLVLAATLQLTFAFRRYRERFDPVEAVRAALEEKRAAAYFAAATTSAGFGVFVTSPLVPVSRLGVTVALTILVAVPLAYRWVPPLLEGIRSVHRPAPSAFPRRLRRIAVAARRRRGPCLVVAALLFLAGAGALVNLPRETNALTFFAESHPLLRAFRAIEGEGGGLSTVEVLASTEDLTAGGGLGAALATVEGVSGVFGPGDVLAELKSLASPFAGALQGTALRRSQRLDESGRWQRWTVRFPTLGATETRELVERIDARAHAFEDREGIAEVHVTGTLPAMLEAQDQLIATLLISLGLTFCVTVAAFLFLCRGVHELVAALCTNLFPVACSLSAAWALGFALDAATVMVAAVVLGLAVDNTFHLVHAARGEGSSTRRRLLAFQTVGGAAVASSAALAVGFASLAFSGFAPTARFGLLTAIGALGALVGDLVLLPALWIRTPKRP